MADHTAQEWVVMCKKCGQRYPLGTPRCTKPTCKADLNLYGDIIRVEVEPFEDSIVIDDAVDDGGIIDKGDITDDSGTANDDSTIDDGKTSDDMVDDGDITIDSQFEAKLQREKQEAQKRIDAAMGEVLDLLSKEKEDFQYREKYTVGFKNISAQMQQCRILEEVHNCVVQAETLRDRDLIEIKKRTPLPPENAKAVKKARKNAEKRVAAAKKKVLKALSKKKRRKQYRERFEAEFTGIQNELANANTVNAINSCADKAEQLRDEKLEFIAEMKNKLGFIKTLLLVLLILLIGVIIVAFIMWNPASASAITIKEIYLSGTSGQTNEGAENLFDNNATTKWCVTQFEEAHVIWKTDEPISADGYIFVTANDNSTQTGRNPSSWTLYACNASSTPNESYSGWKEIDHVENNRTLENVNYTAYSFAIDGTLEEYEYYMLVIEDTQGADVMQISEFALTCKGSEFTYAKP